MTTTEADVERQQAQRESDRLKAAEQARVDAKEALAKFRAGKRLEILEGIATRTLTEGHPVLVEITKRDLADAGYEIKIQGDYLRAVITPTQRIPALEREQEAQRFFDEEKATAKVEIRHADEGDLLRHAEKQGVSRSDAWNYFSELGFDMSGVPYGD